MGIRKIAYPSALVSLLFFALTILFFGLGSHLTFIFVIICFIFAIISLIGNAVKLKKRENVKGAAFAVVISLIPIIVIFIYPPLSTYFRIRQHSEGHGSVYTIYDMRKVALAIQYFAKGTEAEIPQQLDKIFQVLYEYEEYPVIFTSYGNEPEDLKEGQWKDYWGRPIRLVVNSPTEYKFISYGFNGKDDQGEEDDLIVIFDPQKVGEIERIY